MNEDGLPLSTQFTGDKTYVDSNRCFGFRQPSLVFGKIAGVASSPRVYRSPDILVGVQNFKEIPHFM